jgi:excisionase family DNA binding protein
VLGCTTGGAVVTREMVAELPAVVAAPRGPDRLVDATAAGELLGVPASWVLAQARAGRIPHVRLGRYVRFEPEELCAWWRGRRRGPGPRRGA